jgi:glutaredoxin
MGETMAGSTMRPGLVMYGTRSCNPCRAAAQFMEVAGLVHEVDYVEDDVRLMHAVALATGQRTVPQFFFNGQWLSGGLEQVKQLAYAGMLPLRR